MKIPYIAPCWMRAKTNFSRSEAVMSERVGKEALLIVPPSIAQMFGVEGVGLIIFLVFAAAAGTHCVAPATDLQLATIEVCSG